MSTLLVYTNKMRTRQIVTHKYNEHTYECLHKELVQFSDVQYSRIFSRPVNSAHLHLLVNLRPQNHVERYPGVEMVQCLRSDWL